MLNKITSVKKIKIFADDEKNNLFLIQKEDGQTFRAKIGSRFFERLTVENHWTGRNVFSWIMGTTPDNDVMNLLNSYIGSGEVGECSYRDGFPENF